MKIVFNQSLPKIIAETSIEVSPDNVPRHSVKTASFEFASQLCHTANIICTQMQEIMGPDLAYDVKWHKLNAWDIPCIPGWHCDGTHPTQDYVDEYLIWYIGGPGTQFIADPLTLDIEEDTPQSKLGSLVPSKVYESTLQPNKIYQYNKFDFHRGGVSIEKQNRLLIRAWKTKFNKRDDRIFTPTQYQHELDWMTDWVMG